MAKGYRPVERDQEFLLPPNMTDWLPAEHLVWFVIDTVASLDTSALHARAARRRDGAAARSAAGRASYDPDMLLTLLVYAYACGERSSRRIERLCATDVALRLICAGDIPDHTVIARFRQVHEEVFAALFTQVLRLCRAVGLVRLGTIAIDGSKIAANASKDANHGKEWFRAQTEKAAAAGAGAGAGAGDTGAGEAPDAAGVVAGILAEADIVDTAEDALFDTARGDELPPTWTDRHGRRERLRRALEVIDEQEHAVAAARVAAAEAAQARAAADVTDAEQALARARARQQDKIDTWVRVWDHALATRGKLPCGAGPCQVDHAATVVKATARVHRARARHQHLLTGPDTPPAEPDTGGPDTGGPDTGGPDTGGPVRANRTTTPRPPRANATDPDSRLMPTRNGWLQAFNTQFAISADQAITVITVTNDTNDTAHGVPMMNAATHTTDQLPAPPHTDTDTDGDGDGDGDGDTGLRFTEPVFLFDAGYASQDNLTAPGPNRLIALGKTHSVAAAARDNPATGTPPPGSSARQAMDHQLRTPEGAALYKRRGATVEPGIGNFKKILPRFSRRGLRAAQSEAHLAATVFNLLKIYRATTT